jgi:hypothetical protein
MRGEQMAEQVAHPLTGIAQSLLAALKNDHEWITRREIARNMGRAKLLPYHVALLNDLVKQGLVEVQVEQRPTRRGPGNQCVYRVANGESKALPVGSIPHGDSRLAQNRT